MRWTRHGIACMACSRWPVSFFSGALLSLVRARASVGHGKGQNERQETRRFFFVAAGARA